MPTYAEAAVEAFERTNNEPKTVKEIWGIIENHGLKESSGKTPWATLGVELSRYSDKPYDSVQQGEPVLFKRDTDQRKDTYELIEERENSSSLSSEPDAEPTADKPLSEEESTRITEVTSHLVDWHKIVVVNNNGNLEYWKEKCESYTYFFTDGENDFVKIGRTEQNPEKREKSLKTSNINDEIKLAIPETRISEKYLHDKFEGLVREKEWYFKSREVRRLMNREKKLSEKVAERYKLEQKMGDLDDDILGLAGV